LYNLNKNNIQNEYICILKNKFNKLTPIIAPADYIIINNQMTENKFNKSENMLKMIGVKDDLLIKLLNIRNKINKHLVYGIKNKGDAYRIEIYLYSNTITEFGYENVNYEQFKKDLTIILNEFSLNFNNNINKMLNENNVILISFDLDLNDSSFNNKLHVYVENENKLTIPVYHYTYTYDIETNEFIKESNFTRVLNYDQLLELLNKYNMNQTEFINELKDIYDSPSSMMFHYKYYNNSIGIYMMDTNVNKLEKFLKKYNHKNLINNINELKDLHFDLVVNYDLNQQKINGTGFSDYF